MFLVVCSRYYACIVYYYSLLLLNNIKGEKQLILVLNGPKQYINIMQHRLHKLLRNYI